MTTIIITAIILAIALAGCVAVYTFIDHVNCYEREAE